MPSFEATVGPNRTITLPAELCRRLDIKQGTQVEFFLTVDGQVHFHALTMTASKFGGLTISRHKPPVSIREIDDAIADHVVEDHKRIARQSKKPLRRKTSPAAE